MSLPAGFVSASRPAWWVIVGCGAAVLVLGLLTSSRWALDTVRTVGPLGSVGAVGSEGSAHRATDSAGGERAVPLPRR